MIRLHLEIHDDCIALDAPLVRLAKAFSANLEDDPEFQGLCVASGLAADAPHVDAYVVLCDKYAFEKWDVDESCVGCHAVTSGPFEGDDEDELGYMRRHVIAVNVDVLMQTMQDMIEDGESAEITVEAGAATIAHEAVHLAYLLRFGAGRTPHEIYFDEGDWGLTQASTLEGTEWDPVVLDDDEDCDLHPDQRMSAIEVHVEEIARHLTPRLMPDANMIRELGETIGRMECGHNHQAKG